jgi:uncharacterized MAPEG superfamily protein
MSTKDKDIPSPSGLPSGPVATTNPWHFYAKNNATWTTVSTIAAPFLIHLLDTTAKYEANLARLGDFQLIFISLVAVSLAAMVAAVTASHQRYLAHVAIPTQYVYQSVKAATGGPTDAIVLAETGAAGAFNRAQRAYANMRETLPLTLAMFVTLSTVCPRTVLAIALFYAIARVLWVIGYTSHVSMRMTGFLMSEVVAANLLRGVLIATAWRAAKNELFP